jgi:peptide-methionine (S)-S-oxide reductase
MSESFSKISHHLLGTNILPPFPETHETVMFGMGCFWGAERLFWEFNGIYTTAVGYAGGILKHPTYEDVCSGNSGHAEVVLINYNSDKIKFGSLLEIFLENHDPTQGNRQGNDIGTQYKSCIYTTTKAQNDLAISKINYFQTLLKEKGFNDITTELKENVEFYYAEKYHQQYLAKNPNGYCGIKGTGVRC